MSDLSLLNYSFNQNKALFVLASVIALARVRYYRIFSISVIFVVQVHFLTFEVVLRKQVSMYGILQCNMSDSS